MRIHSMIFPGWDVRFQFPVNPQVCLSSFLEELVLLFSHLQETSSYSHNFSVMMVSGFVTTQAGSLRALGYMLFGHTDLYIFSLLRMSQNFFFLIVGGILLPQPLAEVQRLLERLSLLPMSGEATSHFLFIRGGTFSLACLFWSIHLKKNLSLFFTSLAKFHSNCTLAFLILALCFQTPTLYTSQATHPTTCTFPSYPSIWPCSAMLVSFLLCLISYTGGWRTLVLS